MIANLALAPRYSNCRICREISHVEDVTVRLLGEGGVRLGIKDAMSYVKSVGLSGSPAALRMALERHRRHVETWIERGNGQVALTKPDGTSTIQNPTGPTRWLDVTQTQMEVGLEASRMAQERLAAMEDRDLVAVMRVGAIAAKVRGDLESRGRSLDQVDALLMLAAGYRTSEPVEVIEGKVVGEE